MMLAVTTPVLILAGGLGTRLSSVVKDLPKALAPVSGVPFLEHVVRRLARDAFTEIVLLTGYGREKIREYFGDGSRFGTHIQYSEETKPLGTGGAVRQAIQEVCLTCEDVLVLNGDTWFDVPLRWFLEFHRSQGCAASLALKYREDVGRYGSVFLDRDRVRGFQEKGATIDWGLINGGVYALKRDITSMFPDKPSFSMETETFPGLASAGALGGIPFPGRFIDIGVPDDYRIADAHLARWIEGKPRKAVFLDRDGVINVDSGYASGGDEVKLVDGALDFMRSVRRLGYDFVIVTNQAGIAKGKFTESDYHAFMAVLMNVLHSKGVEILESFYCPFHPEGTVPGYRRESFDRKPAPGMILKAAEKHSIDLLSSWMIGDKDSDRIALPYMRALILKGQYPFTGGTAYESFHEILEVIRDG